MDQSITPAELKCALTGTKPTLAIDARKPGALRAAPEMIAGALWHAQRTRSVLPQGDLP